MSTDLFGEHSRREQDEAPTIGASVQCFECRRLVPLDEVVVPEAVPYLIHFCGLGCYAQWRGSWCAASTR